MCFFCGIAVHIAAMETTVMVGSLAPSTAADTLLDEFMLSKNRHNLHKTVIDLSGDYVSRRIL